MHETFVIEFATPAQVVPSRALLLPLGLALLEARPGRVTLANIATPADAHWGLRARELARRLRQGTLAVRLETPQERQQRRERAG
jgi:hypothetical protein